MYLGAYIEFLIAVVLTLKFNDYDLSGEIISVVIAYLSMGMTLVILPILLIGLLFVDAQKLKEDSFSERWGALYGNLNTDYRSENK